MYMSKRWWQYKDYLFSLGIGRNYLVQNSFDKNIFYLHCHFLTISCTIISSQNNMHAKMLHVFKIVPGIAGLGLLFLIKKVYSKWLVLLVEPSSYSNIWGPEREKQKFDNNYTFCFISNSIFDPLSLRFSKIVGTWLATVEPQIVNS